MLQLCALHDVTTGNNEGRNAILQTPAGRCGVCRRIMQMRYRTLGALLRSASSIGQAHVGHSADATTTCRLELRCTKTRALAYSGYSASSRRSAHASVSNTCAS